MAATLSISKRSRNYISNSVLVTGATGFAGAALLPQCVAHGYTVHGTCQTWPDTEFPLPLGATLHEVDLRDGMAVARLVEEIHPDLVIHLAAESSVAASWRDPLGTISANTAMQFNLLEAIRVINPAARIVVVGSGDEYGAPATNPVRETDELRPANPYALSKVAQDLMGAQYADAFGIQVVRLRPFLQLGPRRVAQFAAGSFARQVARIAARVQEPVLTVGNIDLVRDFSDVRDVTRAYLLAAERGKLGQVYNIASGVGHSLRDMINCMLHLAGIDAEIRIAPELVRHGEAPVIIGDASRLREATGWEPHISWEESVRDTLAYWQAQVALEIERGVSA